MGITLMRGSVLLWSVRKHTEHFSLLDTERVGKQAGWGPTPRPQQLRRHLGGIDLPVSLMAPPGTAMTT